MRYLLLALLAAGGCGRTIVEYHWEQAPPQPEYVAEAVRA